MTRVATPFLRLAGVRVEPRNHSRHDTPGGYGITPCATDYNLVHVADGSQVHVTLPAGACPGRPSWTADGKRFAFQNIAPDAVELWLGDAASGEVHRVPGVRLNPMLGSTVQWMADQKTLLVKLVPDGLGAPPPAPVVPSGPSIQETGGEKGQSSTYETRDTLTSKHDEDLFDYYVASQLAFVDAATGAVTPAGKPGAFDEIDAAPDGQHILVTSIHRPYSYVTTYDRFARDVDVWDRSGAAAHRVPSVSRTRPNTTVRSPIASRSTACPRARATSPGARRSRRPSCGRRRSTAATGTSRFPRATKSCSTRRRSPGPS